MEKGPKLNNDTRDISQRSMSEVLGMSLNEWLILF